MAEEMTDLPAALAAFQDALPTLGKGHTAMIRSDKGNYQYKYADLADVSAAVLPALAKQGLAWTTAPTLDGEGRFVLRYELLHVSGEKLAGIYPLPAPGDAQAMGSAITYARRYTLCSVTGVVPDEDDDGAAATQGKYDTAPRQQAQPPAGKVAPPAATPGPSAGSADDERARLANVCRAMNISYDAAALYYKDRIKRSLLDETDPESVAKFAAAIREGRTTIPDPLAGLT